MKIHKDWVRLDIGPVLIYPSHVAVSVHRNDNNVVEFAVILSHQSFSNTKIWEFKSLEDAKSFALSLTDDLNWMAEQADPAPVIPLKRPSE